MPGYNARPYLQTDFPRLCELHDAARLDELRLSNLEAAFLPLSVAAGKEGLFEHRLLVAEHSGQVDGFVGFTSDELTWLYVSPESYRNGIGTLLVRRVIETGGPEICLEVMAGNEPALAFYKSMGFCHVETASGVMPGNEEYKVTAHRLVYRCDNA